MTLEDLDRDAYVHEAVVYDDAHDLLAVVVPFLEAGGRDGEVAIVELAGEARDRIETATTHLPHVQFMAPDPHATTPASVIRRYHEHVTSLLDQGATRVRIVGELPPAATRHQWRLWARYEAAINVGFAGMPIWSRCLYDRHATPAPVLDDVRRLHPWLHRPPAGRSRNAAFVDPVDWDRSRPSPPPDPLESTRPVVDVVDGRPDQARAAVAPLLADRTAEERSNVITALSEVVANAILHGEPPTRIRAWVDRTRVVVTVEDRGTGPRAPFAGLLPRTGEVDEHGRGLWIAHQLCGDLTMSHTPDGFRVRIVSPAAVPPRG